MPYNAPVVEKKWQKFWLENKSFRALDPTEPGVSGMKKAYVLDMFPYPSGAGLHVGHPEGYTATDIYSRYLRMNGYNVLHPMGWDAFGLPAEQYAVKTNTHPAETTAKNITNFRRQIQSLGLSYDWDREVDTTDPSYYRWTQWIFLQLFNSYFDPVHNRAMPIGHLVNELQNDNYVVGPDGSIRLNPTAEGLEALGGEVRIERTWKELSDDERRDVLDNHRLAYTDEIPVNWCPGLGTVLANEEVIDGKSEVGGYPVERRPMRQWMLRITAYSDRLIADLDTLEWSDSLKEMQRNWIGRSEGAEVDFEVQREGLTTEARRHGEENTGERGTGELITVFTTRPDTLYGATFMVLAPEHPLVDSLTSPEQRAAVLAYREAAANKSERDRMADAKTKSGVFTGGYAINPVTEKPIPVYIADYVLMGYGTGAIMAVPAHDDRDFAFAKQFGLPITPVVMPKNPTEGSDWFARNTTTKISNEVCKKLAGFVGISKYTDAVWFGSNHPWGTTPDQIRTKLREACLRDDEFEIAAVALADTSGTYVLVANNIGPAVVVAAKGPAMSVSTAAMVDEGVAINSPLIDGLPTAEAKARMIDTLEREGTGRRRVTYKLRDWLFSRQRYWGEPFPIVLDDQGRAVALPESDLPVLLPQVADFKPTGTPEPPLSKAKEWLSYSDAAGARFTRETNTMPQWAGSCWYYLRYIDPKNEGRFVDPVKEGYWMAGGGVDLYVGGVEHAVLHLLYARFWHKVLFDLGHVSTAEPFKRLVNQGLILGETEYHFFEDDAGRAVSADEVTGIDEENSPEHGIRLFGFRKKTGPGGGEVGGKLYGKRLDEVLVEKTKEGFVTKANPAIKVDARSFKMSKSRGNVVNPDEIVAEHGADVLRLYEMYMGPLEATKPWNTRDIVGMDRFVKSVHRTLVGDWEEGAPPAYVKIEDVPLPDAADRALHRAIKKIGDDIRALRFNTAIAELIKLNNDPPTTAGGGVPRIYAETFTLLLAPFCPHLAEELWEHLGHPAKDGGLARHPWPKYEESKLIDTTLELPVQVNGKLRGKVTVPADAPPPDVLAAAAAVESVKPWLEGKSIKKQLYVPKKLVNFVVA